MAGQLTVRNANWLSHLGGWQRGREGWQSTWEHLYAIWSEKLWAEEFDSWSEFCDAEVAEYSPAHIYRMMKHVAPNERAPRYTLPEMPERHTRELKLLPAHQRKAAYNEAARASGGDAPKLPALEVAVSRRRGGPGEAPPLCDAKGLKVDERFREVFEAASQFDVLLREIAHIKGEVKALVESAAGGVLAKHRQQIEQDRQNLLRAVKFAKPYACCPYCGGRMKECKACEGRGWVTQEVYDTSPANAE